MGKLNIRATDAPQGTIVKIAGDVTVEEVDELDRQLQALAALGPKSYVLDLSGTSFAASLAIGCMLRFRNEITAAGGRVVLADVQPLVRESFRHAQLHRVFSICDTVDEALGQIAVN
ncbi:MAG: STAS domain-containing protein [Tepidisphaeraceae bacterium]